MRHPMIEKMIKLDCTDFLLFLTGHNEIVVHEFEGQLALIWHITKNTLTSNKSLID